MLYIGTVETINFSSKFFGSCEELASTECSMPPDYLVFRIALLFASLFKAQRPSTKFKDIAKIRPPPPWLL